VFSRPLSHDGAIPRIWGVKFRPCIFVTMDPVSFGSDTSTTASQLASASSPTCALVSDPVA
jgi:hypothetical protein